MGWVDNVLSNPGMYMETTVREAPLRYVQGQDAKSHAKRLAKTFRDYEKSATRAHQ